MKKDKEIRMREEAIRKTGKRETDIERKTDDLQIEIQKQSLFILPPHPSSVRRTPVCFSVRDDGHEKYEKETEIDRETREERP